MRNSAKRRPGSDFSTQTLLAFDLDESSSDSDFRIEDHDDESDDFSVGSKEDRDGGDDDDDEDDDDDDDGDDDDDEDSDDEDDDSDDSDDKEPIGRSLASVGALNGVVRPNTGKPNDRDADESGNDGEEDEEEMEEEEVEEDGNAIDGGVRPKVKGAKSKFRPAAPSAPAPIAKVSSETDAAIQKMLMKSICCACLGDRSDDQNEIVECDGCGVTVHEGCYGVSECTSVSSTISSCSTEPWFCDACKAGVENPDCELCPNKGGIFKETDVGRWVHLVCALYVPGVAFGEVDQLSSVTLFEMPYNKWGAKTCSLCEDAKLARTGVCIGCDAGMCKTYFHVTCAQYVGLLSEAHSEEADQADPFYAHCKIHSDKSLIKHRKRNYNTIRMKAMHRQAEEANRRLQKPTPEAVRIERKLTKHRRRYVVGKETKNPPWVPTQKMPRLLITSATACKKMLFKGELMGLDMAAIEFQEAQIASLTDVRKKWHIPPAFSVEFIGYYLDRAIRLVDIKKNLQEQTVHNARLLEKQQLLRVQYDRSVAKNQDALRVNEQYRESIAKIYEHILALCPNKTLVPIEQVGKPPSVSPPYGKPHQNVVINTSHGVTPAARTMSVPTAAALKMGVGFPLQNLMVPGKRDDTGRILSTQCKQNSEELLNECGICKRCNDQHLLAKCDTCHLHYHLGCLHPPLTRHPKKSKLYGWQCSECDKSDDSNPESIIIPKAPRKSRTRYSKDGTIVPYDFCFTEQPSDGSPPVKRAMKCLPGTKPERVPPSESTNSAEPTVDGVRASSSGQPSVAGKSPGKRGRKKKSPVAAPTASADDIDSLNSSYVDEMQTRFDAARVGPTMETHCIVNSLVPVLERIDVQDLLEDVPSTTSLSTLKSVSASTLESITSHDPTGSVSTTASTTSLSTLEAHIPGTLLTEGAATNGYGKMVAQALPTGDDGSKEATVAGTEKGVSTTTTTHHKHSKRRKEKHRNRSPNTERIVSKDHKRKRKRKNHDYATVDQGDVFMQPDYGDSLPRIKIKIKSVPDGSNTHTTQIFYVRDETPPDDAGTHLISGAADSSSQTPECKNHLIVAMDSSVMVPAQQALLNVADSKPSHGRGRIKREVGNRSSDPVCSTTTIGSMSAGSDDYECDVCHGSGTLTNIVQCDECHKTYHFGCLDPPLKKTPKRRGYSWHCADCDPTDVEN